ncbi:MAG: toprim domain-containing protein [Betaproteobacteria bacterium]|nr:toprim domain-containing protein [Betaproteobacteria bacterium]
MKKSDRNQASSDLFGTAETIPDSTTPIKFQGTDNPRELRAIAALMNRPNPREALDKAAGCSNGPDLVFRLNNRHDRARPARRQCVESDETERIYHRRTFESTLDSFLAGKCGDVADWCPAVSADSVIFNQTLQGAFEAAGMQYPDKTLTPGKWNRFSTNDRPGDTAGFCFVFPDDKGAKFGCNREGTFFVWQQRDARAPKPTPAERQAAKEQYEAQRKQAAEHLARQRAKAAADAVRIWAATVELDPDHGYVFREGITPYAARQDRDGSITLAVYGSDGEIQSLQFIGPDGGKRFLHLAKMKGGRLYLGKPVNGDPLILCEGWATGCSLHEATAQAIVVCFSGGNMAVVAADIRRQFPDSLLRIAGDLDAHGKGLEYATAAAAACGGVVTLPVFADGRVKGDFNDLHQAEGLDSVRDQLNAQPDTESREVAPFLRPALPKCDARDGTQNTRPLTEYGNAQRLFDANGERLKFIYDAEKWLAWTGKCWQWDGGSGVRSLAAGLAGSIYAEGGEHLNDAEHFAKWARKSQDQRTIAAAVSLLSDFSPVRLPLACLDADHFIVGFDQARQVIDLRNGAVRPARTTDYVTKSLAAASVGDASKAVRWVQFLDQVFDGDRELIDWLQRFTGYLLTGSTREQIFLFCFGHGANGKSVFIELLKHILGDYARAIASETLSESKRQAGAATPDLAALIGARLVISSETEDNTALAESLVKSLVSGDSMAVREVYAAPIQFTPNFKLLMAGNHKPIVRGNDHGIWRRVRLVPFNRTFSPEERDPQLLAKLKAETPHILAWMVQGCVAWQTKGLADVPAAIRQATNAYQVDQDLTGRWLEECTAQSSHGEAATGDLYANYKIWSLDNGLKPASAVSLGRRLSERGYVARKSHGKRFLCGLTLTDSRHDDYSRMKGGY